MTPRGSTHVRDAKGVRHLATLARSAGSTCACPRPCRGRSAGGRWSPGFVDAADSGISGPVSSTGSATPGRCSTTTAKDAYRSRLAELDELISEAERFNDIGRASQLGVERDLLVDQLAQAVGLGGRDRRAVSVSERARVNVTRAIRSAIRRIGEADRDAGHYLDSTVVTGAYCVFDPQRSS